MTCVKEHAWPKRRRIRTHLLRRRLVVIRRTAHSRLDGATLTGRRRIVGRRICRMATLRLDCIVRSAATLKWAAEMFAVSQLEIQDVPQLGSTRLVGVLLRPGHAAGCGRAAGENHSRAH